MPKLAPQLTAAQVEQLTATTAVGGIPGLTLAFDTATGARAWVLRFSFAGVRRNMGLGGYPSVSLKEARTQAAEAVALTRRGIDPIAHRDALIAQAAEAARAATNMRRNALHTFKVVADEFLEFKRPEWDAGGKSYGQWEQTIREYMNPVIGHLPISAVTTQHCLQIVQPIWTTKHETARRTRNRLEKILAFAGVKGYREHTQMNPAQYEDNLEFALPKVSTATEGFASMAHDEIAAFLAYLSDTKSVVGYNALCFTILTGVRTNNVLAAKWEEIDWEGRIWNSLIDVTEIKGKKKPYRVALSDQAIDVLKAIKKANEEDGLSTKPGDRIFRQLKTYVGRGTHGAPMSNAAMHALVKGYAGDTATVHGFRKSLRSWGAERQIAGNVLEKILNHKLKSDDDADAKLVDTYQTSDLLELRRPVMQQWADHVMPKQTEATTA